MSLRCLSIVALSLALVPAAAQAAPASKTAAQARASEPAPTQRYDFDNDDVKGQTLSPEGSDVGSRPNFRHESLIKVRGHFIPQMLKMANDV